MNKKIAVGVIGLAVVVGVAGIAASTTYARGGGMTRGTGVMRTATSTEAVAAQRVAVEAHRTAVDKAIQAGDYAAWKTAMSALPGNGQGGTMTSVITEANFPKLVEMHKLMTQADSIRKDLGLGERGAKGQGMHGRGQGMMGFRQNTGNAVTNQ